MVLRTCGDRLGNRIDRSTERARRREKYSFADSALALEIKAKMEQILSDFAPFGCITNQNGSIRNDILGRGKRIRTSGPCVPNAVLYQAELFPDVFTALAALTLPK